ncbi:hypothetical protein Sme01_07420 [Sphaerisporangium melleum]|uniref:Secreted protein n=1 Tax=Sphaerisporangium melleum TaxID=321316 RepID=A0A917QXB8_9ACTN|nr:hypothetical protein [Sphaerisporangium melleum]GGK73008.1 hypothetical protein GCM10007964_14780 [Sphaerisporangium melleum]GII68266.1 hypothetical protein Sme01_07420 [Sphaerisporangium melleum]
MSVAFATAVAGGIVALSFPAAAQAGTETRSVPGHRVALHVAHAPAVAAKKGTPPGECKKHCPPAAAQVPESGIDSALATPTTLTAPVKYIGLAQPNGVALVRDPTSVGPANPPWHDLSGIANYPGRVIDITLTAVPTTNVLHITVHSATGFVRQTTCTLTVNVTWPGNCTAFTDFTPPL